MNPSRRNFLTAMIAAPVAAPAIVAEAATGGGMVSGNVSEAITWSTVPVPGQIAAFKPVKADGTCTFSINVDTSGIRKELDNLKSQLEHLTKMREYLDTGAIFPNSSDIGAPHVPAAEPVPFSADECRCTSCQLPEVAAPSLVPGEGSYPGELSDDQIAYVHERADARRDVWKAHESTPSIAWTLENAPLAPYSGPPVDHSEAILAADLKLFGPSRPDPNPLASVDSANRDMARAATEAGYAPLREYVAKYTPVTVRASTTPPDDLVNPKTLMGARRVDLSLLPAAGVIHGAHAMMDGAVKYGPYNWREKKVPARTYIAAAQRHLLDFLDGEENAADSGVHHLGHVIGCCAIVLDAMETGNLIDDRPEPGAAARILARLEESIKARRSAE